MSKLIKFEVKKFPAVRLIGKQVKMSFEPGGNKAADNLWSSMWQDGSMEFLLNNTERFTAERDTIGWMGDYDFSGSTCTYIAGVLTKAGTPVPAGYVSRDLPECLMGIGWIQGREENADLYANAHEGMMQILKEYGYEYDALAGGYEMQYYSFPRFGVPRYVGEKILILDYCCPCKKIQTENDLKENNVTENGVTENGVTENGVTENGVTENDVTESDITENGVTDNQMSESDITKNELDAAMKCDELKTDRKGDEFVVDLGKVRKNFDSLAQRIIYAYKCTYPICIPIEEDKASESSQRQMHGFLHDVINRLYNNPGLLNLQEETDDFYEVWMGNNSKPELDGKMRKIEKVLFDFYAYLYKLGVCGEVNDHNLIISKNNMKFVKKRLQQLEQFGLSSVSNDISTIFYCEKYPELFPAWKLLCDKKESSAKVNIARFIYCMYDISKFNAEHLFGNLIDDSNLIRELERYFDEKGFHKSFDEFGIHWDKEYLDKQKGNAGFSFHWKKREQMAFSFRVPNFRIALSHFEEMNHVLKELTFSRTKICDGCGYCTQMDKTGKRMPLTLDIKYDGKMLGKCPLFPNLTWRNIDNIEVEHIKELFDFTEVTTQVKK